MKKDKILTCPACKADLRKEGICYIEDGCYNELRYSWDEKKKEWGLDSEENGESPAETYYTCRGCHQILPDGLQEYLENNI